MKTLLSGLVVIAGMLLCGCSSYRLQGQVEKGAASAGPHATKYWIGPVFMRVDRRQPTEPGKWNVNRLSETRVRRGAILRNPSLFASLGEGVPIEVTIRVYSEAPDVDYLGIPFGLSFGIYPMRLGETNPCEITVAIEGARDISGSCVCRFREDVKFSSLSPLGLIRFDAVPGVTSCRRGSGIMAMIAFDEECREEWASVFVETLVDGIQECIIEIEKRTPPGVLAALANAARARP